MKNLLIMSTALVAVASVAQAAEPLKASVGGYMFVGVGANDIDGQDSSIGVLRDGEIHFKVKGSSDNGLTFDGKVELEAWSQGGDIIDENWARVSGSFGSIKIGADDHASYNMATGVLYFMGAHIGVYDAFGESGGPAAFVTNNRFGDDIGVYYNTPNFNGFQAEISWQPNGSSDGAGDSNSLVTDNNAAANNNQISIGLNYQGEFNGVEIRLSGGWDYVDELGGNGGSSEDAFMAGAQIGYMGFVLGGHYKQALVAGDTDDYVGNIGYKTGPWGFGLQYARIEQDLAGGYEVDKFAGWVTYALAPGVSVGLGVEHQNSDGANPDGTAGMAVMSLGF